MFASGDAGAKRHLVARLQRYLLVQGQATDEHDEIHTSALSRPANATLCSMSMTARAPSRRADAANSAAARAKPSAPRGATSTASRGGSRSSAVVVGCGGADGRKKLVKQVSCARVISTTLSLLLRPVIAASLKPRRTAWKIFRSISRGTYTSRSMPVRSARWPPDRPLPLRAPVGWPAPRRITHEDRCAPGGRSGASSHNPRSCGVIRPALDRSRFDDDEARTAGGRLPSVH